MGSIVRKAVAGNAVGAWAKASGIALAILVLLQFAAGFYLNSGYAPTLDGAREAVESSRQGGFTSFVQGFHYWGSAWLIAHGSVHVLGLLFSGRYREVPRAYWIGGLLLLLASAKLQVTGNLLPLDRHDVSTAVTEAGIAERLPLVGSTAKSIFAGGDRVGLHTVELWHRYDLWLLAPLAVGALLLAFAAGRGERTTQGPSRFLWIAAIAAVCGLAFGLGAPFGDAATQDTFSDAFARPSWYTLPMHGALTFFQNLDFNLGWIGSALLPALFGLLLLLAPWLGQKQDALVRATSAAFVVAFGIMALPEAGAVAPAWGKQEAFSYNQGSGGPPTIDEAMAAKGNDLAIKHCTPCHGKDLKGTGTPDLTTAFSRRGTAAEFYIDFLENPSAFGSSMPAQRQLTRAQREQLAEWLRQPK